MLEEVPILLDHFDSSSKFQFPNLLGCGSSEPQKSLTQFMDLGCLLEELPGMIKMIINLFLLLLSVVINLSCIFTEKMCTDPLYKSLGRNLCTKVTFSFPSLLFVVSFYNLWKVSNRLEKCTENLIQTCQYNTGFSLNKTQASFPLSKAVSPKILL